MRVQVGNTTLHSNQEESGRTFFAKKAPSNLTDSKTNSYKATLLKTQLYHAYSIRAFRARESTTSFSSWPE
jgi:hypothetical protein